MNRCRRIVDQFLYRACVDRRLAVLGTSLGPRSLVTLFAGAGGADVGLKDAGWDGKLMVERNSVAAETLVAAREQGFIDGKVINGYVEQVDYTPWRGVGLLWSSFPCQGFSPAGKGEGIKDERDGWRMTVRAIDQLQPRWFIGENSSGLSRGGHQCTLTDIILADLKERFAYADYRVLSAADYGVPQQRERLILVAGPRPIQWPEPTHVEVTEEMLIQARQEMGYSGAGGMGGREFEHAEWQIVEEKLRKVGKERYNTILDVLAPDWAPDDVDFFDDPRWEYLPTIAGIWEDEDEYVERRVSEGADREEAEQEFDEYRDNWLKECRFCGVRYSLDYGQGQGEKTCFCEATDTPEYIEAFAVLSRAAPTVMAALKPDGKSGGGRRAAMVASAKKRPEMDKALRLVLEYRNKADDKSLTINPRTGDFFGGYSPAEAAAIQGFPPGYPFQGTAEYQLFGQIGNAVPPKLAEVVARAVAEADIARAVEEIIARAVAEADQ